MASRSLFSRDYYGELKKLQLLSVATYQLFYCSSVFQNLFSSLMIFSLQSAECFFHTSQGANPGFFLGGGALVSCSTSTPTNHIVFFCRIPVVLENPGHLGWGGGGAPPAPSP